VDISAIETVQLPHSELSHAACVRAGPWIFANGIEAIGPGLSEVQTLTDDATLPMHGLPRHRREGDRIAERLTSMLATAGTSFENTVRLDQYYPTWKAVDPYHRARRAAFGRYIPPSTSVVMRGLLPDGADISTNLIAVLPGRGLDPQRVEPPSVTAPTWSGFVPAAICGELVFVAGQMARGPDGPDPRAHVPAHSLWGGHEARKQAEYVIDHRLLPALQAAGASASGALKAQAYLRHAEDLPHFLEVWNDRFGDRQVALTIVQACDFGLVDGSLEINLVALRDGALAGKRVLETDIPREATFGAHAVMAAGLVFASGLMACDRRGADASLAAAASGDRMGVVKRAEMAVLVDHARKICRAAGIGPEAITRALHLSTALEGFHDRLGVWADRTGLRSIPYCAAQLPSHPVPGCTTTLDIWAWAGR